jgi:hypothetical protein
MIEIGLWGKGDFKSTISQVLALALLKELNTNANLLIPSSTHVWKTI